MYLSEIKLWNFRKYGIKDGVAFDKAAPALDVHFHNGVNVLIGENDSGKTTIIDAIRYVLHTKSGEPIYIDEKDFYKSKETNSQRTRQLKIECFFDGINDDDAALFLEWLGVKNTGDGKKNFILKVCLSAKRMDDGRIIPHFYAGMGGEGNSMSYEARNYLNVVYLKPLRDALQDMTHGYKSRLAQILQAHSVFSDSNKDSDGKHQLETDYNNLKAKVDGYFNKDGKQDGGKITKALNTTLTEKFLLQSDNKNAVIQLTGSELSDILRQLDLVMEDNKSGLGSLNLLCMAAELLLFSEKMRGLKLTLVEELEAHLHPQLQLRLIDYLESKGEYGQFILTTHSITLGSTIPLKKLLILKDEEVFPMDEDATCCTEFDYRFLQRFLDATKANLFFAKGLILVEGDAENLLIPTIAKIIGKDLHEYGVSIVNVGSTAYKRYVNIFRRKDKKHFNMPISIITDLDVRSIEYYEDPDNKGRKEVYRVTEETKKDLNAYKDHVQWDKLPVFFMTKTGIDEYIDSNKVKRIPKAVREDIHKIFDKNKESITKEDIDKVRELKLKKLCGLYQDEIQIFTPKKWTLEYDIACSKLCNHIATAIKLAEIEGKGVSVDAEEIEKVKKQIESIGYEENNSKDAYTIFKPLNDCKVSKAITAQYLASLLENENNDTIKKILLSDPYISYLVDAIKHVTSTHDE